jgi:hypothetical protein
MHPIRTPNFTQRDRSIVNAGKVDYREPLHEAQVDGLRKPLKLVDAQGIEPWTSPV